MDPARIAKSNLNKRLKAKKERRQATIDLLFGKFSEYIKANYTGESNLSLSFHCGDQITIPGNWGYLPSHLSNLKELLPEVGSKLEMRGWLLSWVVDNGSDYHAPITFYLRPNPEYKSLLTRIKEIFCLISSSKKNQ